VALRGADRVGHALLHRVGHHLAGLVGHLLDALFLDDLADRVGNLLDAGLLHHAAGRRDLVLLDERAALPAAARAFALVGAALLVNIGALLAAGHRVGDLLLDDFLHLLADRDGDLAADLGAFLEAAAGTVAVIGMALAIDVGTHDALVHRVGNLLDAGVGDLDGNLVGDLLHLGHLDPLGAGHHLAGFVRPPDLAALVLGRALAGPRLAGLPATATRIAAAVLLADVAALLAALDFLA